MTFALSAGIAIFLSSLMLWALSGSGRLPVDQPNARSLHARPLPRGGGTAIWAATLAATVWLPQRLSWLGPLLLLIAVSFWDDRRGASIGLRLSAQVAAAVWWLWLDGSIGVPECLAALLAILWMTNLYNFMDGSDGLAALMTVVGFGAFAVAAAQGAEAVAPVSVAIVAATVPFLVCNRPPARILLGDVGAIPLGFMAAVLGITGWQARQWPAWFPVLVFLPFIADATLTLGRRLVSGAAVWRPHRDHAYQRLVRMRLGHGGALAVYGALMVGTATSALIALFRAPSSGTTVLSVWAVVLLLLHTGIGYHWHRGNKGLDESKC